MCSRSWHRTLKHASIQIKADLAILDRMGGPSVEAALAGLSERVLALISRAPPFPGEDP